jgi:RNA polymerase sigma-B factor
MTHTVRGDAGAIHVRCRRRPAPADGGCACRRPDCHQAFVALAATSDRRQRALLRDRLVERHLVLARRLSAKYRPDGRMCEDTGQVAALALVEAVDRFDPARGVPFSAFAIPTIDGAIKRHFRDNRWVLRTPRRLKELYLEIRAAREDLAQRLGAAPTVAQLSRHLGCHDAEVLEALRADDERCPLSLDAPASGMEDAGNTLAETVGDSDESYERIEYRESLRPLLAALPARELRVVTLRFFGNLTQAEIAEQLGCSQMHVSRLLRAALNRLRQGLLNDPAPAVTAPTGQPGPERRGLAPGDETRRAAPTDAPTAPARHTGPVTTTVPAQRPARQVAFHSVRRGSGAKTVTSRRCAGPSRPRGVVNRRVGAPSPWPPGKPASSPPIRTVASRRWRLPPARGP